MNPVSGKIFTWDIHYACNYRCTYCYFSDRWQELEKSNVYPGIEKWIQVWDAIYAKYGSCYIHISGGEPFCYPDIMDLVAKLVQRHTLGFDTNLFFDIPLFLKKVSGAGRIGFSATFHPDSITVDEYLCNVKQLRAAGYTIKSVNFVAYPPHIRLIREYRSKIEREGLTMTILPYRGMYEGKEYPQSYSEEEKECVWGVQAKKPSPPAADTPARPATVSMLNWYGGDKGGREGKMCKMGEVYSKVHPDGTAHRCCMTWENWGRLGNMLDGSFSFYDAPRPCPYAKCSCSSAMIVGEEQGWRDHWLNRTR